MVNQVADEPAVRVTDLRVDYGDFVAVNGIDLEIPPGEIFGLVGPNGAGKTSTFRVLATLMEPTYGEVSLCGLDVLEKRVRARQVLGYMPDLAPMPSDLKVWEFLDLFATAQGLGKRLSRERIADALEEVELQSKREDYCKDLSRGMKQRLALAKTILHRPKVLLLDEPASGMDPVSRAALRGTLQKLARDGATILVSSHILTELAAMCTSVGIMSKGSLVAAGSIDAVLQQFAKAKSIRMQVLGSVEPVMTALRGRADVSDLQSLNGEGHLTFQYKGDEESQVALLADLVKGGCRVKTFAEIAQDMESVILGLEETNAPDSTDV